MAKLSKKQKVLAEKIEPDKNYAIEEAVSLITEFASTKFSESFDVSINLGIDPRKSDQVVRGSTTLPSGTGKRLRLLYLLRERTQKKPRRPVRTWLVLMT